VEPRTPVIVGAAQLAPPQGAPEGPIAMAVAALRLAAQDAGPGERLLSRADAVGHVATICWPYGDEAALVAAELGVTPRATVRTAQFGGDGPVLLVAELARGIADGEFDVALLSGAEAIATLRAEQRAGSAPDWPSQELGAAPTKLLGTERMASNDAELAVGLAAPLYVYALLETALRGRLGTERDAHQRAIAELWSRFSEVGAGNPYAKLGRQVAVAELLTANDGNRPVSAPYTKLLTANADVDLATGLIMCSAQAAADAGVPRERWVFPRAAAHGHEEWFVSERRDLAAAPALGAVGRAALEHAGTVIDEVGHIDLYSCFPSAVQIAAAELGLTGQDRPLTVTGGLTFAGGPGNNYTSHAIATLVQRLRADPDAVGLCTAVGWYVTKHAALVLGGRPGHAPFAVLTREAEGRASRPATADYRGRATIEAYTVPYARDGSPEALIVSALAPDGTRLLARSSEPELVQAADPLGRSAEIAGAVLQAIS
jgi:acetyl-CoA C-acetyltransferase